jgi:tetratricopeptide (TPR) repeat protein
LQVSYSALFVAAIIFISGCAESAKKATPVSLYVDAVTLADSNSPDKAIEKLAQAIEKNPDFAIAYSLLGRIYLRQEKLTESAQAYEKATAANPWSFEDFQALGRVYRLMSDFTSAAQAYVKACQLDPQSPDAHLGAADAYYELGDYENALNYGLSARDIDPADGEIEKLLGDIYTACQDDEMAIDSYKRTLELRGNDPNVILLLAVSYLHLERFDSAKELLESLIASDPLNADACRHLGFTYLKLGEIDLAIQQYADAVGIDSGDWRAHKGIGVAYMMKYRLLKNLEDANAPDFRQKALGHWSRSLDLNPAQDKLLKLYRKYAM